MQLDMHENCKAAIKCIKFKTTNIGKVKSDLINILCTTFVIII